MGALMLMPPTSLPAFIPAGVLATAFPRRGIFLREFQSGHGHRAIGMNVREDGAIAIHNFRVSGHPHVRLGIGDGLAVRRLQPEARPHEMIGDEQAPVPALQIIR